MKIPDWLRYATCRTANRFCKENTTLARYYGTAPTPYSSSMGQSHNCYVKMKRSNHKKASNSKISNCRHISGDADTSNAYHRSGRGQQARYRVVSTMRHLKVPFFYQTNTSLEKEIFDKNTFLESNRRRKVSSNFYGTRSNNFFGDNQKMNVGPLNFLEAKTAVQCRIV